jgi:fatty-acid desaturase
MLERRRLDPFKAIVYLTLHFGAVAAFFFVTRSALLVTFILYLVAGLGVTLGYHRLVTHRSYETFWPVKALLAVFGSLAFLGGPIDWAGKHRRHHSASDKTDDVHCPRHGLWWSQLGWLIVNHPFDPRKFAPDAAKVRYLRVIEAVGWLLPLASVPLIYICGERMYSAGISWVLWAVCFRAVFSIHVAGFVNTIAHLSGNREFATFDDSRNVWWVALLTLGEGWHNNHHASPRSAAHGRRWYQIDPTYWLVCLMERAGIAWNVVHPGSEKDLAALTRHTGERHRVRPSLVANQSTVEEAAGGVRHPVVEAKS